MKGIYERDNEMDYIYLKVRNSEECSWCGKRYSVANKVCPNCKTENPEWKLWHFKKRLQWVGANL